MIKQMSQMKKNCNIGTTFEQALPGARRQAPVDSVYKDLDKWQTVNTKVVLRRLLWV